MNQLHARWFLGFASSAGWGTLFVASLIALMLLIFLVGCATPQAMIVWQSPNGLLLGSGDLPVEMCREELAFLTKLHAEDRGNFGQRRDDPATWLMSGRCVLIAPRWDAKRAAVVWSER